MPHADRNLAHAVDPDRGVIAATMQTQSMQAKSMQERLIVGLDVPTVREAEQAVRELDGVVSFYKIGYQLAFAGGLDFARELASGGTKIFLDMKLLDIDNTVAKGVENIVRMGMTMLTLHAYPRRRKPCAGSSDPTWRSSRRGYVPPAATTATRNAW